MSLASRNPSPEKRARMSATRRLLGPRSGQFKGVSLHNPSNKWLAQITIDGKHVNLNRFADAADAARAYDAAAYEAWGDGCYLNFPENYRRSA